MACIAQIDPPFWVAVGQCYQGEFVRKTQRHLLLQPGTISIRTDEIIVDAVVAYFKDDGHSRCVITAASESYPVTLYPGDTLELTFKPDPA